MNQTSDVKAYRCEVEQLESATSMFRMRVIDVVILNNPEKFEVLVIYEEPNQPLEMSQGRTRDRLQGSVVRLADVPEGRGAEIMSNVVRLLKSEVIERVSGRTGEKEYYLVTIATWHPPIKGLAD